MSRKGFMITHILSDGTRLDTIEGHIVRKQEILTCIRERSEIVGRERIEVEGATTTKEKRHP